MSTSFNFINQSIVFSQAFKSRLEDQLFADLLIQTGDGQKIHVHQLVLAVASPIVEKCILESVTEDPVVIILPDFGVNDVKSVLDYLYGGCDHNTDCANSELVRCLQIGHWSASKHSKDLKKVDARLLRSKVRGRKRRKSDLESETKSNVNTSKVVVNDASEIEYLQDPVEFGDFNADEIKDDSHNETLLELSGSQLSNVETDRRFLCTICSKGFDYEKNLKKHLSWHKLPVRTKFGCSKCDQIFSNKSSLHYHVQKHNTPTHQCASCPRSFKSVRGLRYHMNLHEGVADFLCDDCGKGFVTRQKLTNHRRAKHTFEKPYICDQCGQGFIRSDKLTVHKRRAHTGEKPYQCDFCDWKGVDSSSLIHHRKKHANLNREQASDRKHDVTTKIASKPCSAENYVSLF